MKRTLKMFGRKIAKCWGNPHKKDLKRLTNKATRRHLKPKISEVV